jgi:sugar lactone lactonase YvrE
MNPALRRASFRLVCVAAAVSVLLSVLLVVFRPPVEPFDPAAWSPALPLAVDAARVDRGAAGTIRDLVASDVMGPEDLATDAAGRVHVGTADGRILRTPSAGASTFEEFVTVGGRPLGLAFASSGDLLVANHEIGLQSVSPSGAVTLLAESADGEPIHFANDLAVADDGTVYLSDSNSRYNSTTLSKRPSYSIYDLLDGHPRGRLIRYDPVTRRASTVVRDLYFPNGVAVTADQRAVLVVESTRYRVTKVWVAGERAGTSTPFIDAVPGIGDGLTRARDGRFLLTAYDRVNALDRWVLPSELARHLLIRAPTGLLIDENEPPAGSILVLSPAGNVERLFAGIHPAATNVVPYLDGWLLGTLSGTRVRVMPTPPVA